MLRAARFQGKSLNAGQGLPHRDWAWCLTTQQLLTTTKQSLKILFKFGRSVQKLFMIFCWTDTQFFESLRDIKRFYVMNLIPLEEEEDQYRTGIWR